MSDLVKRFLRHPLRSHDMIMAGPDYVTGEYVGNLQAVYRKTVCRYGCGYESEIQVGWSKDQE